MRTVKNLNINCLSIVSLIILSINGCASNSENLSQNTQPLVSPYSDLVKAPDADGYYKIARHYQENGSYDMAFYAYKMAIQLGQGNTKYMTGLATSYADKKKYEEAISQFKAIVLIEANAVNLNNLAYAYYLAGEYELAESAVSQALQFDPEYTTAKKNMVAILEKKIVEGSENATSSSHKDSETAQVVSNEDASNQRALEALQSNNYDAVVEGLKQEVNMIKQQLSEIKGANEEVKVWPVQAKVNELDAKLESLKEDAKVVQKANNVYEINYTPTTSAGYVTTEQAIKVENNSVLHFKYDHRYGYVQILNGNGVKGFARKVRKTLIESRVVSNIKVNDAKHYSYRKTIIEYRPGYGDLASELKQQLPTDADIKVAWNLPANMSVRVTMGRDSSMM